MPALTPSRDATKLLTDLPSNSRSLLVTRGLSSSRVSEESRKRGFSALASVPFAPAEARAESYRLRPLPGLFPYVTNPGLDYGALPVVHSAVRSDASWSEQLDLEVQLIRRPVGKINTYHVVCRQPQSSAL